MKKFTNSQKLAGEMATRDFSNDARRFYESTDPLKVYEYDDDGRKLYAVDGAIGYRDSLTFEELDEYFAEWQREIDEEDE